MRMLNVARRIRVSLRVEYISVEIYLLRRRLCDGAYSCAYLPTCSPQTANLRRNRSPQWLTKLSFHREFPPCVTREIRSSLRIHLSRAAGSHRKNKLRSERSNQRENLTSEPMNGRTGGKDKCMDARTEERINDQSMQSRKKFRKR